jgi:hypothetical protein
MGPDITSAIPTALARRKQLSRIVLLASSPSPVEPLALYPPGRAPPRACWGNSVLLGNDCAARQ